VIPTPLQIDLAKARVMTRRAKKKGSKVPFHQFLAYFRVSRLLGTTDDCLLPTEPMWTIKFGNKLIRVVAYYYTPQGYFLTPEDYESVDKYDVVAHVVYHVKDHGTEITLVDPVKLKENATLVLQGWQPEGFQRRARTDRWMFVPDQVSLKSPLSMS
jgi:hypothetical protein